MFCYVPTVTLGVVYNDRAFNTLTDSNQLYCCVFTLELTTDKMYCKTLEVIYFIALSEVQN